MLFRVPFPIPRILTRHQISPHFFYCRSTLGLSQLDLFIPEDLSVVAWPIGIAEISESQPTFVQLPKPPIFTGSLELSFITGIDLVAYTLLSLPSGPHFRRLGSTWYRDEDISLTAASVDRKSVV